MTTVYVAASDEDRFQTLLSTLRPGILRDRAAVVRVSSFSEMETILEQEKEGVFLIESGNGDDCSDTDSGNITGGDNRTDMKAGDCLPAPGQAGNLLFGTEEIRSGKEAADVIRRMIQKEYMLPLGAGDYAERVHLSLTYVCRIFKEQNGIPIGKYILKMRMNRAAELLRDSNLMIRDVAEQAGFNNFSYFSKKFRDFYSCSPSDYRRQNRRHRGIKLTLPGNAYGRVADD